MVNEKFFITSLSSFLGCFFETFQVHIVCNNSIFLVCNEDEMTKAFVMPTQSPSFETNMK